MPEIAGRKELIRRGDGIAFEGRLQIIAFLGKIWRLEARDANNKLPENKQRDWYAVI